MIGKKQAISEKDLAALSARVGEFEDKVAVELVMVLARRSIFVYQIPTIIFLLLLCAIGFLRDTGLMERLYERETYYWWILILPILYFTSWGISKIGWIQRAFTSSNEMEDQVRQRALLEFYLNRVHGTRTGNGLLLFVSMLEKKAVVYADPILMQKISKDLPQKILEPMLLQLRKGEIGHAFLAGIQSAENLLVSVIPQTAPVGIKDFNEICNNLIIKD